MRPYTLKWALMCTGSRLFPVVNKELKSCGGAGRRKPFVCVCVCVCRQHLVSLRLPDWDLRAGCTGCSGNTSGDWGGGLISFPFDVVDRIFFPGWEASSLYFIPGLFRFWFGVLLPPHQTNQFLLTWWVRMALSGFVVWCLPCFYHCNTSQSRHKIKRFWCV